MRTLVGTPDPEEPEEVLPGFPSTMTWTSGGGTATVLRLVEFER